MTIKDVLIEKGWTSRPGVLDNLGPYLINIFLTERGVDDPLFRRYYYKTKILTKADDIPLVHNPSIKLLWLLNPDIERVRYTSESGVVTEISFK